MGGKRTLFDGFAVGVFRLVGDSRRPSSFVPKPWDGVEQSQFCVWLDWHYIITAAAVTRKYLAQKFAQPIGDNTIYHSPLIHHDSCRAAGPVKHHKKAFLYISRKTPT